jgi:hypothetical protein
VGRGHVPALGPGAEAPSRTCLNLIRLRPIHWRRQDLARTHAVHLADHSFPLHHLDDARSAVVTGAESLLNHCRTALVTASARLLNPCPHFLPILTHPLVSPSRTSLHVQALHVGKSSNTTGDEHQKPLRSTKSSTTLGMTYNSTGKHGSSISMDACGMS